MRLCDGGPKGWRIPLPASDEVLLAGLKIFKMNCAGCHGTSGEPSAWGMQNFYPRVPQFAQQSPRLSAPQIFVAVKNGIRYSGMGAWKGMLSDEEIWKVATFIEHIHSLPPPGRSRLETASVNAAQNHTRVDSAEAE